jgi:hypothetical protein
MSASRLSHNSLNDTEDSEVTQLGNGISVCSDPEPVCQKSNQGISNIHEYSWLAWLEYGYYMLKKFD